MALRNKALSGAPMRRWLTGCAAAAGWLLLWQLAHGLVGQELLLPAPMAVFRRVAELSVTPGFWRTVCASLGRILTGFSLAVVCGTVLAGLTARFRAFYGFIALPMDIIKATPVASFVILALIWISGRRLSAFIAFLMVLPMVWRNVHDGIAAADVQLLEMARVYRLSAVRTFQAVILPSVLPYFVAAVRVGAGFAWKAGVAGEVIAIPNNAIGTQLYHAKVYLETVDLFAWSVVIIILSILLEKLSVYGARRLSQWLSGGAGNEAV